MTNILCFGDSNTYGLIPYGGRLDDHTRWTRVLARLLGDGYWIHEEGLSGRTICQEHPDWPHRNAMEHIEVCLETHEPLDLTILMLGTNDMKGFFHPTVEKLTKNLGVLASLIMEKTKAPLLLVSPPHLGEGMAQSPCAFEFPPSSVELSRNLAPALEGLASQLGADFLDAALYASTDPTDCVHLLPEGHNRLAHAFYKKIKTMNL